jgi:hypothetical protein
MIKQQQAFMQTKSQTMTAIDNKQNKAQKLTDESSL